MGKRILEREREMGQRGVKKMGQKKQEEEDSGKSKQEVHAKVLAMWYKPNSPPTTNKELSIIWTSFRGSFPGTLERERECHF